MKKLLLLLAIVAAAVAQPGKKPEPDRCGFGGNIHDCHCADRVAKIRAADIATCDGKKGTKAYDDCVRAALAGHDHCSIAERSTHWDADANGEQPYPEGDHVASPMGEYCKRACKPHHCQCSEQSCDFK